MAAKSRRRMAAFDVTFDDLMMTIARVAALAMFFRCERHVVNGAITTSGGTFLWPARHNHISIGCSLTIYL
jgi:hypothetical protein